MAGDMTMAARQLDLEIYDGAQLADLVGVDRRTVRRYIVEQQLNELMDGPRKDLGIIVQGGIYNSLVRALQQFGLCDAFGQTDIPILVLNVTYPLVPEQVAGFALGKRAVLVVEEGQPEYIEQEIATFLQRNAGSASKLGAGGEPPRITRTERFIRKHREVAPKYWTDPRIKSAANCEACHTGAAQGRFSEHDIAIRELRR